VNGDDAALVIETAAVEAMHEDPGALVVHASATLPENPSIGFTCSE
jgi:hypothetical protein